MSRSSEKFVQPAESLPDLYEKLFWGIGELNDQSLIAIMVGSAPTRAIAERENGILKTDFRLNRVFVSGEKAEKAVEKSIYNYNHIRPHMSCGYLTPVFAHQSEHPLKKYCKPKVYPRSKVVRDQGQFG